MNIVEITERFPGELDVVKYMEAQRWGTIPLCPYCNSSSVSEILKDLRRKCYDCDKTGSVTVNTMLHNTRLPLKTWLLAFSIATDAKKGFSALQLKSSLSISYPTSFKMYHTIRELMFMDTKSIAELDNIVEIDQMHDSGKPKFDNSGNTNPKEYIFSYNLGIDENIDKQQNDGIVEHDEGVVAEVMKMVTAQNIREMVKKYVDKKDSIIITNQYAGYKRLDRIIKNIAIDHHKLYSYKGINTNTIESFWTIIKQGIIGQYHKVSPKYLPNYIAEFVFKNNKRQSDDLFNTLVKKSITTKLKNSGS